MINLGEAFLPPQVWYFYIRFPGLQDAELTVHSKRHTSCLVHSPECNFECG